MPTDTRERRRHKARVAIARAAMDLFREHGYEATTVQDIAATADISYRTFFRYFATKEDVVFPDIELHLEQFRAEIAAIPTGAHPWPAIREGLLNVIDRFEEPGPEFSTTTLRVWMDDPGMAGPYARFCRRWSIAVAEAWMRTADGLGAELAGHIAVAAMNAAFRVHLDRGTDLRALVESALDRIDPLVAQSKQKPA